MSDVGEVVDGHFSVHVGRQAIYDTAGDVVAYELLFRDAADAVSSSGRGAHATSKVIVATFSEFGLHELVGDRPCFVNVTREFLTGELPVPFDASQVGLEILRDVPVDREVLAGVAALAEAGYSIAVDDFAPGQERELLLDFASYAKVDLLDGNVVRARSTVALCRQYGHVQLIAQRLESQAMILAATNLGFELFQGHVLGRPHAVSIQSLGPARLQRLQLLAQLSDENPDMDRIVAAVESDPALAMRVLRLVNAAAGGLPRKVGSIGEAVILTGLDKLRQWVTLMLVADLADGDEAHLQDVIICARLCQTIAERDGRPGGSAFMLGLLAAVADLWDLPVGELAGTLPLNDTVNDALVHSSGELAGVLATIQAHLRGEITAASASTSEAYLAAMRWTTLSMQRSVPAGAAG